MNTNREGVLLKEVIVGGIREVDIVVVIEAGVDIGGDRHGVVVTIIMGEEMVGIIIARIEDIMVGGEVCMRGEVITVVVVIGEIVMGRVTLVRDLIMVVVIEEDIVLLTEAGEDIVILVITVMIVALLGTIIDMTITQITPQTHPKPTAVQDFTNKTLSIMKMRTRSNRTNPPQDCCL